MITRDFSVISIDVTGVSLSLSTTRLTKVTHAQYRKRFRVSYNTVLFSDPAEWRALACAMAPQAMPLHTSICKTITAGRVTSLKSLPL